MSKHPPTCQDCYFHRHALCALALERPCPTFRAAERVLCTAAAAAARAAPAAALGRRGDCEKEVAGRSG